MADGFTEPGSLYEARVEGVGNDGAWVGVSADAALSQFAATRKQFSDAQVEARAIASILRDAHGQFAQRIRHVQDLVEQAQKNGIHVDGRGQAVYDPGSLSPYRTDYDATVKQGKEAAETWTQSIKDAVRTVDDADQGVKLALQKAAGIKSFMERAAAQALGLDAHSFNGDALGDIEVYEAREAKMYADQVLAGKRPDDLEEWERLMRDNSGDRVFSQTLLDSLGPDNTLKLSNKIDDLAYFDDAKRKGSYLRINSSLADSLATATRVPEFYDPMGNRLQFGTAAYNQQFGVWQGSKEAQFYNRWREALRDHGVDHDDLESVSDKVKVGPGHGQQVRGYQSLATLMQQGHGYSPQFVADVTDDMIEMEKRDPNVWGLYGKFDSKNGDAWFANDPVDAVLGVMSHNAEGAAGYLDPGTEEGKRRYEYLLGNGSGSRDWDVTNTTNWDGSGGKVETRGPGIPDGDTRQGLGDALVAAATGIDPAGTHGGATPHSDVNNRVFERSLEFLSKQGNDMPAALRDDMAKIMTNHGDSVYATMSNPSGHTPLNQGQVMEMTKQISRSEESYGMLHEGMNYAIVAGFHDSSRRPEDTLEAAGYAVGFMEEGRYSALKGDQHDYTWDKAWSYHTSGALLNFLPVIGDIAQRGADVVTTAWIMDEQKHQADQLTSDSQQTYIRRQNQLNALADQWYARNSTWADAQTGYSAHEGIYKKIAAAANDGNAMADGLAGSH
ncbi:hypothetical protein [Streptomyces sp. NPDC007172]|uniref:hypothetical protein n=1 Tax=Streptomyces sp. NPDC007172 TaxID=3364776 RepID=UPI00369046AD